MDEFPKISHTELHDFTRKAFVAAGVPEPAADDAAAVLVWANLRGIDTHGVRNLRPNYLRNISTGRIKPDVECMVLHETPVSARVHGCGGLGLSAARWAMRFAMQKAKSSGMAFVAMANSYHFGAAGHYPWMALDENMIGIALTGAFKPRGSEIGVVPTFAAIPMFSTNPIAISFPTGKEAPYLLDMATSISPYNRIQMYKELGRVLPNGWGMDHAGQPTTDPALLRQLLPLGGTRELGSHKGYGLAMMVQILCAILSGGWTQGNDNNDEAYEGYFQSSDAHFLGALRVDAFCPLDEFKAGMDTMIRALHDAPKAPGQERIYIPGEPEYETELERRKNGIPLPPNVIADLREVASEYKIPLAL